MITFTIVQLYENTTKRCVLTYKIVSKTQLNTTIMS